MEALDQTPLSPPAEQEQTPATTGNVVVPSEVPPSTVELEASTILEQPEGSQEVKAAEPESDPVSETKPEPVEASQTQTPPEHVSNQIPDSVPQPEQKSEIQERIIERIRKPDEAEKEQMFKTRLKTLSPKGVSARRGKRQANFDKIIAYLREHGYIANDEVEKLCRVKDATATLYLRDLVRQGTIIKLGSGRGSRYRLMQGNQ